MIHRILLFLAAFFMSLTAQAPAQTILGPVACIPTPTTFTANLNLTKPGHCATNYDALNNANFELLDSIVSGNTVVPWSFTSSQVINFRNAGTHNVTASIDPTTGNVVVNNLLLAADPTLALQAATKQYVDAQVANFTASVSVDTTARTAAAAAQSTANTASTNASSALSGSAQDSTARSAAAAAQASANSALSGSAIDTTARSSATSAVSTAAAAQTSANAAVTTANSALSGSANDSTARSAAAAAQTAANNAQASTIPSGTGYAYRAGSGSATSLVAKIPYTDLNGTPTIPTTASWPNGGVCTAGTFMTGHANGAIPACSSVAFSALSGVPSLPVLTGSPVAGNLAKFISATQIAPLGSTGTGNVVLADGAALTGVPTSPTNLVCSADTQIANGAYVAACATGSGGGSGGGGIVTTTAQIVATMDASSNANSSVGTAVGRKAMGNCYTGYTGSTLQPTTNGGNLYCTAAIQTAAVAAGGPSLGVVTATYSGGSNVAAFTNGNGAGGTYSPNSVSLTFGASTNDSACTTASASAPTGVSGLTFPGCGVNASATYSQTTGTGADTDTLIPSSWTVASGDSADHLVRESWWRVNNLATLQNLEFDTNYHPSTSDYYGWGWQYNNQTGKKMFQFCPQLCTAWTTVKLVDPTGHNPTLTTYTLVQGHFYHTRIYMHRGPTSTCTAAAGAPCFYYDQLYLEDTTAGTPGVLYNIVDSTTGLTPAGIPVSYPTWAKKQFTLQVQLDMNTANATTSADFVSDSLIAYTLVQGSAGPTTVVETAGNLGEWDFDGSDTSTPTATLTPTLSSNAYSSPGAMEYNAASEYHSVSFTATPTLYSRFYAQVNTIASATVQIFDLYNGATLIGNLYLNSSNQVLTVFNQAANVSTSCGVALGTGTYHLVEFFWSSSATVGAFTVKVDGVQQCAVTGTNTGATAVNTVRFGEVNAVSPAWDLSIDNVGLDNANWLGPVTFTSSSVSTYQPYFALSQGATVAAAATIAPVAQIVHVSGTSAISTITPPASSNCPASGYGCQITLIPDGSWTTNTAGNIAAAITAVVNQALIFTYDSSAQKWYPSNPGTSLAAQYKIHTFGVGMGDGLNVIPAGTYPINFQARNKFTQTVTISSIECALDAGATTVNVADNSGNALLTGAITGSSSWVAGTQSTHITLAANAWTNWTIVADGTTKQVQCVLTGSLP